MLPKTHLDRFLHEIVGLPDISGGFARKSSKIVGCGIGTPAFLVSGDHYPQWVRSPDGISKPLK